jgi:T5SS/PEP-CTERM-associated repeat protein
VYGGDGIAHVHFADGATVVSNATGLGQNEGSLGTVLVEGQDTDWSIAATLTAGQRGQGDLTILDASVHSDAYVVLGRYQTGSGRINLNGGHLSSTNYTAVGQDGQGLMTLSNGASMETAQGLLGWETTASGDSI